MGSEDPRGGRNIATGQNYYAKSNRAKRFFPKYDESNRDRPIRPGTGVPWQPTVTIDEINYLVRRDELAYRTAMKWPAAVFNKWLKIHAEKEDLQKKIEELFDRLDVQSIFKRAYLMSKVQGYCLIALGWEDRAQDATEEPVGVKDIAYIHAIPRSAVRDIHQDKDPMSETYGQITHYTIAIPDGDNSKDVKFPSSRFLHWANMFIDDNPEGLSMFEPLFDKFGVKKNLDFAMGQVPHQLARPVPMLGVPDDADEEEVDDAEEMWKDFNSRSYFVYPQAYKPELLATNIALNPEPYADYVLSTIAAASTGSKVALLGTEAGAVTGSEVNMQEWYGAVADEQANYVEPVLKAFIKACQFFKVLPEGEFWFTWKPLFEMDDNEKADIALKNAQALQATASALVLLRQVGLEPVFDDGEMFFEAQGTRDRIQLPAANALVKVQGGSARQGLTSKVGAQAPFLPSSEKAKLYKLWEIKATDLENRASDNFQTHVTLIQREFMEVLKKTWDKEIGKVGVDPSQPGKNDQATLYEFMDEWIPADLKQFKADLIDYLEEAYTTGSEQTLEKMGLSPTSFRLEDTQAVRTLRAEGARLAKGTYLDMHKDAMIQIAEGLKAGESYAQINDRVAKAFQEFSKGIPNTIHKFVHSVTSEARWDTLEKNGQDKAVFSTSQDGDVRPEHQALEGQIMAREEMLPYLSDFGCRCTSIPLTAYDEAVKAYQAEQKALEEAV